MMTETPTPRPTSSTSAGVDTASDNASVLPFRRRRRPKADTAQPTVTGMTPQLACFVHIDLTVGTQHEQRLAAWELMPLPPGTVARIHVPEGWPDYQVIHALAEAIARRRLNARLEGTPTALRAWYADLRDLIGEELHLEQARP